MSNPQSAERPGEVMVAWPEDHVIQGEQLERLQESLAPYVVALMEADGDKSEIIDICEGAMKTTIGSVDRAVSTREVEDISFSCWTRTAEEAGYPTTIADQREGLGMARWRLLNKGEIVQASGNGVGFTLNSEVNAALAS